MSKINTSSPCLFGQVEPAPIHRRFPSQQPQFPLAKFTDQKKLREGPLVEAQCVVNLLGQVGQVGKHPCFVAFEPVLALAKLAKYPEREDSCAKAVPMSCKTSPEAATHIGSTNSRTTTKTTQTTQLNISIAFRRHPHQRSFPSHPSRRSPISVRVPRPVPSFSVSEFLRVVCLAGHPTIVAASTPSISNDLTALFSPDNRSLPNVWKQHSKFWEATFRGNGPPPETWDG